jgi:CIC family chloride channel protein
LKLGSHSRLRKYTALLQRDLSATYSRDLHKWLVVAPIVGVLTGLLITLIAEIILKWMWPHFLAFFLRHPAIMVPIIGAGFLIAGLLMQYLTPDPDEHSTEEIIHSYHEHQGDIRMRPFVPKLAAAITTVGFGGSAALEGPSIYGGGALGSWLWTKLNRLHLEPHDRRIMLISGAAAGMGAVFRAPLTGIVFALEMPYKDDLAHEALLPSLIASVAAYATLASFLGTQPLFNFAGGAAFSGNQLLWAALLGLACGLLTMGFNRSYRRVREFMIRLRLPHWIKMTAGGILTGLCGWMFLAIFPGHLVPVGPDYEAVGQILQQAHGTFELVAFGVMKLAATLFTLGVGGVSAMFVPLFLTGGSFGAAFAQSIGQAHALDLYAAVGMAAFLAGGYKAPLTAVVFVAEATGGHSYIIPALIGAAVAYAVSGEVSVSADQRVHETVKVAELWRIRVSEAMQRRVISIDAHSTLREFLQSLGAHHLHAAYPVSADGKPVGVIAMRALGRVPAEKWDEVRVSDLAEGEATCVPPKCTLHEALSLLTDQGGQHMLLVISSTGKLEGILTKTDLLSALHTSERTDSNSREASPAPADHLTGIPEEHCSPTTET